jgi:hypothetical protein
MVKAKSKATIMVADGTGGMTKLQDHRFESHGWPINFDIPKEHADVWPRYFNAECEKRKWSTNGIVQFDDRENSGSLTVNVSGGAKAQLGVIWERKRGGSMRVRARSAGELEFPVSQMQEVFALVPLHRGYDSLVGFG